MNIINNLKTASNNECMLEHEDIEGSYNLNHHILSVFILLIVSFIGTCFSIVTTRIKRLHINPIIINTGKFFGSGIILATGFIHMLPPAMESLTSPCLPESWSKYSAYAGLFAMLAVLIMQLIEFIAHEKYYSRVHSIESGTSSPSETSQHVEIGTSVTEVVNTPVEISKSTHHHHHHHHHGTAFQDDVQTNKISAYLLEFGIALHSILIGIALGTASESFVALFIALSFHQFFEAIALGAQIARLDHLSLKSIIFMVIFFVLTTPIGIAIGIGIHSQTYNPNSIASLLANGILDAISAGILIYVAIVNLITAEMGASANTFHALSKRLKFLYFVALYAGVAAMAVIGIWA
ncbi:unnamed protein product [Rotaria sp. Silwood1]|nr:unnamed protein product [Rotaria sp. Silwood1]CAF3665739.1 unnamed protein product [Rotaria sp. Silwood1]CAF3829358.1 unnamed protein product [Rotaria sp. Silwood1]CAF4853733.1 unnamed protein product [Rotaria sp. Silwood1]CAF5115228.1 unnamed protein product [Rotaria sp. Silwood1]